MEPEILWKWRNISTPPIFGVPCQVSMDASSMTFLNLAFVEALETRSHCGGGTRICGTQSGATQKTMRKGNVGYVLGL